jgi:hypothetical protein
VLRENKAMLKVGERFEFSRKANPDEPGVVEVKLTL